jgi:hypothetical protein
VFCHGQQTAHQCLLCVACLTCPFSCPDFMINIHMLVWGAKHIGPVSDLRMDADPATTWMDMALAHARQVRCDMAQGWGHAASSLGNQQLQQDGQRDCTCVRTAPAGVLTVCVCLLTLLCCLPASATNPLTTRHRWPRTTYVLMGPPTTLWSTTPLTAQSTGGTPIRCVSVLCLTHGSNEQGAVHLLQQ